ncbi:uncharacterized protein LOC112140627 [Tachysurus ichikawai]
METTCMHISVEEDNQISRQFDAFWEIESLGIVHDKSPSAEEAEALETFEQTVCFKNKRYQVELPWICGRDTSELKDNGNVAKKRFEALKKRFRTDNVLYERYSYVIQKYLQQEICEEVQDTQIAEQTSTAKYYMPHHPVVRHDQATTKLRIVFDASSHDEANIAKVFLQIGLKERDRDVVRFLWTYDPSSQNSEKELCTMRMNRVVFGVASSPFLLAATIRNLKQYESEQPETVAVLRESLYVDDLIASSPYVNKACSITAQAKAILAAGAAEMDNQLL